MTSAIDPERRRTLLQTWGGMTLLGSAGIAGLVARVLANESVPPAQGIRRMSGDVTVNGVKAQPGMPIRPGDLVNTGVNGEVVYVVGQDAFLQRGLTGVSFADSAKGILRVISGKLLSVFGKADRTLLTPTATIGIRGTACYIEAEAERVYFCLCYGEADLVPTSAPVERELIRTTHHDHPLYIHNDMNMPKMMVPAGVINHTDAELVMLESLVGREPPFLGSTAPYISPS